MQQYQKAIAAAAVPVFAALIMWVATKHLDTAELATALAGLFAALAVYMIPNIFPPADAEKDEPRVRRAPKKV